MARPGARGRGSGARRGSSPRDDPRGASSASAESVAFASWRSRNALALLALVPVLFATGKVIAFSRGDPAVVALLVTSLDVPAVLIGSVAPSLGWIIGFVAFIAIANRDLTPKLIAWLRSAPGLLGSALLLTAVILAVLATPWQQALLLIALPLAGLLYRAVTGVFDKRHGYVGADIAAVIAGGAIAFLTLPVAWMPAEVLSMSDGSVTTAYVADEGNGWTTVLTVRGLDILKLKSSTITSRHVCEVIAGRSLLQIVEGDEGQQRCKPEDDRTPSSTRGGTSG